MTVNVDLDVLVYRAGFSVKSGDFIQTTECLEYYLQSIYDKVNPTTSNLILSGPTNFRKEIDPNYKISRKDSPKPLHFYPLREYAVDWLGASLSVFCEADDVLGTLQGDNTILASNDKDMLQVPGYHYRIKKNWNENEIIYIDEHTGWYNFFRQVLMGDQVDSVEGLKGIGEAKSAKLLANKSKQEMLEVAQEMYKKQYGDDWYEPFDKTCRLIFIQRNNAREYFELL